MESVTRRTPPLVTAVAATLTLALAGCAVGPKYVKPEPAVNGAWSDTTAAQVSTRSAPDSAWWRAFGDSTLDSLVRMGYHQNLPLQIAGLRIMEARAQLALAVGKQYPQLQVAFATATGVGLSQYSATGAILDRNYWDYQVGFDAAWELDFWGKYSQSVKAEAATYLASIAVYDDALVSLTAEVARTYAVIRTFEALIQQGRENVTVQQDGLRIAEARFRNGATSELDVTQATSLLESTRSTIPQLESSLVQAENALSTLLGQPTGSVQGILAASKGIPGTTAPVTVSVPAELLRRRPDIRAVELSAIAQCARIGISKAELYPSFSLFGSIGTHTTSGAGVQSGGAGIGNIFSAGSWFYSFGPRLLYSVLNYGRTRNNVRIQDARFQQSLVDYDNTVLRAAQEVEDGLTGFIKAQEANVFAKKSADAAQRSVDIAFIQYREGAVDFQRVLDAQRSLLEEQNTEVQTRSAVARNIIAVYKALGGGWELRRGQAFVSDSTRVLMQNRTNWGDLFSNQPTQRDSTEFPPTPR